MFRPANPNSRIPAVLQSHTKENIIAQLTLTAVFLGGMWVKAVIEDRKFQKQIEQADTEA